MDTETAKELAAKLGDEGFRVMLWSDGRPNPTWTVGIELDGLDAIRLRHLLDDIEEHQDRAAVRDSELRIL